MRSYFSLVPTIVAAALLCAGCLEGPKVKVPEITFNPNVGRLFSTCNKKDSEMSFTQEAQKNRITIEDKIESQDIHTVDCNDRVTNKRHGPIRELSKIVTVSPPENLKGQVNYVQVENVRTCAIVKFAAVPVPTTLEVIRFPELLTFPLLKSVSLESVTFNMSYCSILSKNTLTK